MKNPGKFQWYRMIAIMLFLYSAQSMGQEVSQDTIQNVNQDLNQEVKRIHRFGVRASYKSDEVDLWGAELSYQIYLKGMRRLEVGLGGMSSNTWNILQATFIYQWCFVEVGGLSIYAGPGAGIGYALYGYGDDKFYGVVAANLGIDYTFRFPIQIALDYRPEYSAWQEVGYDLTNQVAFAVRLAF